MRETIPYNILLITIKLAQRSLTLKRDVHANHSWVTIGYNSSAWKTGTAFLLLWQCLSQAVSLAEVRNGYHASVQSLCVESLRLPQVCGHAIHKLRLSCVQGRKYSLAALDSVSWSAKVKAIRKCKPPRGRVAIAA